MTLDHLSGKKRRGMAFLTPYALALIVATGLAVSARYLHNETVRIYQQRAGIAANVERIRYYDSALTDSALLAAHTGNPVYERRYSQMVPKLDRLLKDTIALVGTPEAARNIAHTDSANRALVAIEERSFKLDRSGRTSKASALLNGDEYAHQKRLYASSASAANRSFLATSDTRARSVGQHQLLALLFALLGGIVLLIAGGFQLRLGRNHERIADENERQADELKQTLAEREQAHAALEGRERELRQAQKMEAVGRLAGGVAHDFNNILLTITGYSDLAREDVRPDQTELRDSIDQVKAAATLAAALTGKLLAFSRQQVVQPRVVDMSATVEDLATMLRPMLGEKVELILELDPTGASVKADPGQLEQVVMNLVINARDAMPDGGQVTVTVNTLEVADLDGSPAVPPGRYVRLLVSDTGTGMDEETISMAFDPFFTTKEQGEGTGLGLATVHGIVSQSGGDMEVTSAVGEGTTFSIYLPQSDAALEQPAIELGPQAERGSETVLLVEDVDSVRSVLRKILERTGYEVITASGGAQAIESLRTRTRPVDLLVTDMVMPGISGRDLSRELVALYPELRVIYMSGHTQDGAFHQAAEAGQVCFLQKPFTAITLVDTAREVLAGPTEGTVRAA